MASLPQKDGKVTHFFRIILQDIIQEKKMMLPIKFARNYGTGLSNTAILKVPTGEEWEVKLLKCGGREIWFQEGWQQFSEFHSLEFGDFLFFEYVGNSHFSVIICDRSTTEIDYPIRVTIVKEERDEDGTARNFKKRNKSHLDQPQPIKKARSRNDATSSRSENLIPPNNANRFSRDVDLCSDLAASGGNGNGNAKAVQGAFPFKSKNPLFTRTMTPSCVSGRRILLNVPSSFGKEYLKNKNGGVLLQLSNRRCWSATYSQLTDKRFRITEGWKNFAMDNQLKPGDICVFELMEKVKGNAVTFRVSIFGI